MNDFEAIVAEATRDVIVRGLLKTSIEAQVASTMKLVVSEALSPFAKRLTESVMKHLAIDPEELGLLGYNQTVLAITQLLRKWRKRLHPQGGITHAPMWWHLIR